MNPLHGCHRKKSSQELDDGRIRDLLEIQKERLLAEAKSEILRHEYRADLVENNLRELNRHISQAMEIGHTITGYEQSGRDQARLHEELTERERVLRETRIRSIHVMEELKRAHELKVDELTRRNLIENHDQNTGITK